ncbi:hypothetical protein POM88_015067 [Heracleum sosnowskyi]|uniref:Uncharacterized protein n=1 Tax=Heracleum sosnowskyi TaxID=360622 RepID=A0AAD8IJ65_9APIA|nr:hypothetical protein POM88_015067 [Heracleum sosnowskyi]
MQGYVQDVAESSHLGCAQCFAGFKILNQPKLEDTLPDGHMTVSLLRHQKIALAWMLQKETKSIQCAGGILANDQGLETRPEVANQQPTEALYLDDDADIEITVLDQDKLNGESEPQAGTLIVCPARSSGELATLDVVLTTYAHVENEVPKQPLVNEFGDASGIQSPVSFGGSGSLTRHLGRLTNGDPVLKPFLQVTNPIMNLGLCFLFDVIQFGPLVKTLGLVMLTNPQLLPSIFRQVLTEDGRMHCILFSIFVYTTIAGHPLLMSHNL